MVLLVKTKNNTDAIRAIDIAKRSLIYKPPKTIKQKHYVVNKMRYLDKLTEVVKQLKKRGYQVKQLAFKF